MKKILSFLLLANFAFAYNPYAPTPLCTIQPNGYPNIFYTCLGSYAIKEVWQGAGFGMVPSEQIQIFMPCRCEGNKIVFENGNYVIGQRTN